MIGAVIAAAGLSSRMGAFKPLLPYAGQTIVESTINKLQAVGVGEIIVVVGHRHEEIENISNRISRFTGPVTASYGKGRNRADTYQR